MTLAIQTEYEGLGRVRMVQEVAGVGPPALNKKGAGALLCGQERMNGWKTVKDDGPHFFLDGHSLCGFFTVPNGNFRPRKEPAYPEACEACWRLSRDLTKLQRDRVVPVGGSG